MTTKTKLKNKILSTLIPLIDSNCIYIDLPFHTNIGDTLIWKGTEDFLSSLPYKCLYRASIETYRKPKITKDTVILLHGGGNFGDIWRTHADFRLQIIADFPDNKIIILPQTVYYKDLATLKQDAVEMGKHSNLTICARDKVSHELLTENFTNNILLLPDMAFCIKEEYLGKYKIQEQNKMLFFKRKDQELQDFDFEKHIPTNDTIEQKEWPSMDENLYATRVLKGLNRMHGLAKRLGFGKRFMLNLINLYAINIYMPHLLRIGICFISQYKYIYTTRLHGAILSILLEKPITFFDNSYGKNSTFYEAWLNEASNVKMIKKD